MSLGNRVNGFNGKYERMIMVINGNEIVETKQCEVMLQDVN